MLARVLSTLGQYRLPLLAGAFVVVGIGSYYCQSQRDRLLTFAPLDTLVYVHVRDATWPWQPRTFDRLPASNLYAQLNTSLGLVAGELENQLLPASQQVSVLLLPTGEVGSPRFAGEAGAFDQVLLVRLKHGWPSRAAQQSARRFITRQPNHRQLAKTTYALASSQSALERVQQVKDQTLFALTQRLNRRLLGRDPVGIYVDVPNLLPYLDQFDPAVRLLASAATDGVYLRATPYAGRWQFQLSGYPGRIVRPQPIIGRLLSFSKQPPLLKYLPQDFTFFASAVSVVDLVTDFSRRNKDINDALQQTGDYLAATSQFDPRGLVETFNMPANLLVGTARPEAWLGFDLALVLNPGADVAGFEELASAFWATQSPQPVNRRLADGTRVVELYARPERFAWQDYSIAGQPGRLLDAPAFGVALTYLQPGRFTLLTTATATAAVVVEQRGVSLEQVLQPCGVNPTDRFFILNTSHMASSSLAFLPIGTIIGVQQGGGVVGCFY
ncbi:MAG: hypothetical protein A3J59_03520 [Candidatus Buchananbacteria bacterium RIFCSPHIGHO2_02_FULL_56_16]|uniref:DUF3352 domain-containing protein n=1 Tax=Candidatus Buchananbacteria bacterium RIFCSPHIGHO2_02_FULL_56_16 TaxID=1797542 RepID=A0A1G1YJ99_9BACT|nr:MAG: hypothetical protein A3J59_03520 [Candidatus Buchananbacteria bacterium RIFCSPHIGHO2_02_FULL_56_16]